MGYRHAEIAITGRISNHNDERDDEDRKLWAEFMAEVRALAAQPKYERLEPASYVITS